MKNTLIDISGKLDDSYNEALIEIKKAADSLKISFFIVGALARDIIMEYFYKIKAPRRTTDIDLGIRVSSWNQFNLLMDSLELSGKFNKSIEKHRVVYKGNIIDIVPFGKISGSSGKITWPPENEVTMTVMGFNEVYNNSTLVRLQDNPILEVKVPTLPGLSILKLISWKENFPNRSKDAEDLLFIMKNYEYAGITDRLYTAELKLLESADFDNQIAGILLLGKEINKICTKKTAQYIRKIMDEETTENSAYNLIKDMLTFRRNDFEGILFLLKKLKEGLLMD
jgi:predicted nucleotidyltransferase